MSQKILDRYNSFARGGADQRDRRAQLARQRKHIDVAALLAQLVGHVQQHEGWQPQRDDARRQHQVAVQVGGIQYQDDGVRRGVPGMRPGQHIDSRPSRLRISA